MKRKYLIIVLLVITLFTFIGAKTYSYYYGTVHITVSAQASNIICDAEILEVPDSEKNIYGYSEFKVRVKNYDSSNNVTQEPFTYTLTIENSDASNGEFSSGYANFSSSLVVNGTMTRTRGENDHIIRVRTATGSIENVNYKVDLNCVQKY